MGLGAHYSVNEKDDGYIMVNYKLEFFKLNESFSHSHQISECMIKPSTMYKYSWPSSSDSAQKLGVQLLTCYKLVAYQDIVEVMNYRTRM